MAAYWIELRALVAARPSLLREMSPDLEAERLNKLQNRDEELGEIAQSRGLTMFAPARRAALQQVAPRYELGMIYSFFDSEDGELIAEITGYSRAFIWLYREAQAIVLRRHLHAHYMARESDLRL